MSSGLMLLPLLLVGLTVLAGIYGLIVWALKWWEKDKDDRDV